jgi:hypothetical protein
LPAPAAAPGFAAAAPPLVVFAGVRLGWAALAGSALAAAGLTGALAAGAPLAARAPLAFTAGPVLVAGSVPAGAVSSAALAAPDGAGFAGCLPTAACAGVAEMLFTMVSTALPPRGHCPPDALRDRPASSTVP